MHIHIRISLHTYICIYLHTYVCVWACRSCCCSFCCVAILSVFILLEISKCEGEKIKKKNWKAMYVCMYVYLWKKKIFLKAAKTINSSKKKQVHVFGIFLFVCFCIYFNFTLNNLFCHLALSVTHTRAHAQPQRSHWHWAVSAGVAADAAATFGRCHFEWNKREALCVLSVSFVCWFILNFNPKCTCRRVCMCVRVYVCSFLWSSNCNDLRISNKRKLTMLWSKLWLEMTPESRDVNCLSLPLFRSAALKGLPSGV